MPFYPEYPNTIPRKFPTSGINGVYPTINPSGNIPGWCSPPYYQPIYIYPAPDYQPVVSYAWIYQAWYSYSEIRSGYANTYESYALPGEEPVFSLPYQYINIPAYWRISGIVNGVYYDGGEYDGNFGGQILDPADFPEGWGTIWERQDSRVIWPGEEYNANPIGYGLSRIDSPVYMYDVYGGYKYYTQYAEATWLRPQASVVIYRRYYLPDGPTPEDLIGHNNIPAITAMGVLAFFSLSATRCSRHRKIT